MQSVAIFSAILAATAFALPQSEPTADLYNLKAIAPGTKFDNLCAEHYHTGAGLNDLVMTTCGDELKKFYDFPGGIASTIFDASTSVRPSAVVHVGLSTDYNDWYKLTVTSGGTTGNLTYTDEQGFKEAEEGAGFLVCDWAHDGLPQLFNFAIIPYTGSYPLPSSCAEIKLVKG